MLPDHDAEGTGDTSEHVPPADAMKPDSEAISDVYAQVAATGSLQLAAAKLAAIAHSSTASIPAVMQRRQAWYDDPEEAEFLAQQDEEEYGEEEEDDGDANMVIEHLQEVVEGLWIGDLVAAMDSAGLRERGIRNVVSLLRPRIDFPDDMSIYVLEIDDAEKTDILTLLPSTTAWIREALAGGTGSSRETDIGTAPPTNPGGVFVHCQAGMSRSATVVAAYLMRELNLDPVDAVSFLRERRPVVDPSPTFWHQLGLYYQADGRVNLKDRSTRQWYLERTTGQVMNEGARPSTEHMARYPATPTASQPSTPAGGPGRRKIRCKMCRRHLAVREHMMDHILDQAPPVSRPRTPSNFTLPAPLSAMTSTDDDSAIVDEPLPMRAPGTAVSDVLNPLTGLPGRSSRRSSSAGIATPPEGGRSRARSILGGEPLTMSRQNSQLSRQILDAEALNARLPPQLAALRGHSDQQGPRRLSSSSLGMAPLSMASGPAILTNNKCSGYFVEPLTWMDPMLDGQVSGKLFCPNEKCGVKIGTYDWAGVQCGCKEWVTPGFCLARSKVEEVGF